MIYLTIEDIRICHDQILDYTLHAIKKKKGNITEEHRWQNSKGEFPGKLDHIVDIFLHPHDAQYSPCTRVSRFILNVCLLHPFVEGNKRTAYFVSSVLLNLNGLKFRASPKDAEKFLSKVAKGKSNEKEIKKWIKKRCRIMFYKALPVYLLQAVSLILFKVRDIKIRELGAREAENLFIVLIRAFVAQIEGVYPSPDNNNT